MFFFKLQGVSVTAKFVSRFVAIFTIKCPSVIFKGDGSLGGIFQGNAPVSVKITEKNPVKCRSLSTNLPADINQDSRKKRSQN